MALTTTTVKNASGASVNVLVQDDGSGNKAFAHVLANATATAAISPATSGKQDDIIAALAAVILAAGTAVIGKVDHTTTGIGHGVKTVTTAGTDVVLASSTPAKWVEIQAQTDNTGLIAVGASGVDATVATGDGVLLAAGESRTYPCDNLADFYIDSTVSGDGVRYIYGT